MTGLSQNRKELPRELPGDRVRLDPAQEALPSPSAPPNSGGTPNVPKTLALVADCIITRPLAERMATAADEPIGVVIEIRGGPGLSADAAYKAVFEMIDEATDTKDSEDYAAWRVGIYVVTALTSAQILRLVDLDNARGARTVRGREEQKTAPRGLINRIWPNFEVQATIHRSIITTKADAAARAFDATGEGIVWAVFDTGVDSKHHHFRGPDHDTLALPDGLLHRSFVVGTTDEDALKDRNGHGTHVAGIIAGGHENPRRKVYAATWYRTAEGDTGVESVRLDRITGMAPRATILSIKVLRDDRTGDLAALLEGLEYIQELNSGGRELRVHGINLSLGYTFDPSWFAAGQSPVCREVDRLVADGVCVVASAGNTGYGAARDFAGREMRLSFGMTINDPGNAERAITVGSTSIKPHSTGVSYFSSKGPTGDGRLKPDLVAPGERVVSAGAGTMLEQARATVKLAEGQKASEITYVEDSGTSMSAPHVSGIVAAFLSVHREFIGEPDKVKRVLVDNATDLGRERTFQGAGLVDAMRAIQSV